jgi:hypothetical protein
MSVKTRHQVISALSTFTPNLTPRRMTLTGEIADIDARRITAMTVTSAVTGVNGINTSGSEGTVVVGTTYYLVIPTSIYDNGRKRTLTYSVTATTTVLADLINAFVTAVNRVPQSGVTAANASTHLRITETPLTGQIAGEVRVRDITWKDSAGNTFGTFTEGTAHVSPIGQYTQVYRTYTTQGVKFIGTPVSTSTYTVIRVEYLKSGESCEDFIYVDSAMTTAEKSYITSTCSNYAGQLGFSTAGANVVVTSTATSASGTAIIPKGITYATVTSSSASNFVGLQSGLPIGTQIWVEVGATTAKISLPAGEGMNGGTAAGSATIVASKTMRLIKASSTMWYGHVFAIDGTASDSTGEDQAASA